MKPYDVYLGTGALGQSIPQIFYFKAGNSRLTALPKSLCRAHVFYTKYQSLNTIWIMNDLLVSRVSTCVGILMSCHFPEKKESP